MTLKSALSSAGKATLTAYTKISNHQTQREIDKIDEQIKELQEKRDQLKNKLI